MGDTQPITLLDGGIGHLLKQRGVETSAASGQWADSFLVPALANAEAPSAVRQVHQDYIDAGADVITVNNFPVTPWGLDRMNRQHDFVALTQAAATLAREAADAHNNAASGGADGRQVLVAGSLPPLGESYSTAGGQRAAELAQPVYTQIARTLLPAVDLLMCETMASSDEAWAAASAAAASGLPTWVALTLEDSGRGVLRSGEPVEEIAARLGALPGVEALLLNCCAPQAISAALPKLRAALPEHVRIGASGNGFQGTTSEWLASGSRPTAPQPQLQIDPRAEGPRHLHFKQQLFCAFLTHGRVLSRRNTELTCFLDSWMSGVILGNAMMSRTPLTAGDYSEDDIITPEAYARFAASWVAAGATIVGGCCGIQPAHIRALRAILPMAGGKGSG